MLLCTFVPSPTLVLLSSLSLVAQICRETTELAYDSLGTEITQDEEERTQLYAYQAALGVAGVLFVAGGNAIFAAVLDQSTSFQILGLSIGVGGTLANLYLVWYIKENAAFAEQGTMPLIPGFRSCFANRPYMMYVRTGWEVGVGVAPQWCDVALWLALVSWQAGVRERAAADDHRVLGSVPLRVSVRPEGQRGHVAGGGRLSHGVHAAAGRASCHRCGMQ